MCSDTRCKVPESVRMVIPTRALDVPLIRRVDSEADSWHLRLAAEDQGRAR